MPDATDRHQTRAFFDASVTLLPLLRTRTPAEWVALAERHPRVQGLVMENVSGRGALASTVHDASWVMMAGMVMDGDQPRMTDAGPEIVGVALPIRDVEIVQVPSPSRTRSMERGSRLPARSMVILKSPAAWSARKVSTGVEGDIG